MMSSNWDFFRVTGTLWGESTDDKWQRPVTRSFDVFFYLRLNNRFSKQSRRRWFETPSRSLWRYCNTEIQISERKTLELLNIWNTTLCWNTRKWTRTTKLRKKCKMVLKRSTNPVIIKLSEAQKVLLVHGQRPKFSHIGTIWVGKTW